MQCKMEVRASPPPGATKIARSLGQVAGANPQHYIIHGQEGREHAVIEPVEGKFCNILRFPVTPIGAHGPRPGVL